jgi:DNA-binding transcriptional regulator YiaG
MQAHRPDVALEMRTETMTVHTWQEIKAKKFSPDQLEQIDNAVEQELLEMDLRALREAAGLTQEELAQRVAITQSQLSKLERREDHRISTVRRYVAALGGELEIAAVVDGKRILLSSGS